MILLLIGLAGVAVWVCVGTGLLVPAVVTLAAALWSNGVLANFREDAQQAPNWAASLSMISAAASVVLIIAGLSIR